MATSENNCTENYSLPRGPQGDPGVTGPIGPTGDVGGPGPAGNTGPSGANKLDISIQTRNVPYKRIAANSSSDIAYFIFPGTTAFPNGVSSIKIMGSYLISIGTGSLDLEISEITSTGAVNGIGTASISAVVGTQIISIKSGTFSSFPTTESIIRISGTASVDSPTATGEARVYAFELR